MGVGGDPNKADSISNSSAQSCYSNLSLISYQVNDPCLFQVQILLKAREGGKPPETNCFWSNEQSKSIE